jgi:hypothetical protein
MLQTRRPMLATPSGQMCGVTHHNFALFYSLLISMSLILVRTPRLTSLAAAAFSHCTPDPAPLACLLLAPALSRAPPTPLAPHSSHSPVPAPHPHLAPRFGCAPRCPLPLVAHISCQAEPRPVLLVLDGDGAQLTTESYQDDRN